MTVQALHVHYEQQHGQLAHTLIENGQNLCLFVAILQLKGRKKQKKLYGICCNDASPKLSDLVTKAGGKLTCFP